MNIAIPSPRRMQKHSDLFALVVSLALIASFALVGAWQTSGYSGSSERAGSHPAASVTRSERPLVLFLVDSQEQADMVLAGQASAARERAANGIADPEQVLMVMQVTTPEDEANLTDILYAWELSGEPGYSVTDYRAR